MPDRYQNLKYRFGAEVDPNGFNRTRRELDMIARGEVAAREEEKRRVAQHEASVRRMAQVEADAYREEERRRRNLWGAEKAAYAEEEARNAKRQQARASLSTGVGTGLLIAGAATTAALAVAVKSAADFDQAMSRANAATDATTESQKELREAAIQAGADTQYSATEAADAITALGKAGIKTADILSGGLRASLSLAAAGGLGVAEAAEIMATAATQFEKPGKELPHIADLLAAGAGKAQGEVTDLGLALSYVGPVAHGMGISIEETVGTIAELASKGIIAEKAGTSLRGILSTLSAPSLKAKGAMKELGIQLYDTRGQFVGFEGVAGQLADAFDGMSDAQIDAALGTIFGNEQLTAARVLYEGGAEAVRRWTKDVNDQGFAARQAAELTDNLAGDVERLRGALETALIDTAGSAQSPLRNLTQNLQGLVDGYNDLEPGAKSAVFWIGATGAATLTAAGAVAIALPKFAELTQTMADAGVLSQRRAGQLRGLAGAAGALAVVLPVVTAAAAALHDELNRKLGWDAVGLSDATAGLVDFATTGRASGQIAKRFGNDLDGVSDAVEQLSGKSGTFISAVNTIKKYGGVGGIFGAIAAPDAAEKAKNSIKSADDALAQMIRSGNGQLASKVFEDLADRQVAAGRSVKDLAKQFPEYHAALAEADAQQKLNAASAVSLGSSVGRLETTFDGASTAATAMATAINDAMDKAAEAADKAFKAGTDVLGTWTPDDGAGIEAAGKKVREARQRLADAEERDRKKRTDATVRSVRDARRALKEAESGAKDATAEAAGTGLEATYKKTIQQAWQFTRDVTAAYKMGLDPTYLQQLIQQGPEKAGPVLRAIVSDQTGHMVRMVNESQKTLERINLLAVEQARLTAKAIADPTDEWVQHIDTAMQIAQAKAELGGKATAAKLAKALDIPESEVIRIAEHFGIILADNVQDAVTDNPVQVTAHGHIVIDSIKYDGERHGADASRNTGRASAESSTVYRDPKKKRPTSGAGTRRAVADGAVFARVPAALMSSWADGGIRREHHVAEVARPGEIRQWNEPETEGEAYIPLAPAKRGRSRAIVEDVVGRFGGSIAWGKMWPGQQQPAMAAKSPDPVVVRVPVQEIHNNGATFNGGVHPQIAGTHRAVADWAAVAASAS